MKKLKLSWQQIKGRITGFSIPMFGISWQPEESEIKIAKRIIIELEDKRVLYSPYELEVPAHCIASILEIRKLLTEELAKTSQKSSLYQELQQLRAACRKFLDEVHSVQDELNNHRWMSSSSGWIFLTALGELRGVFGILIAKLAVSYGLDVTGDLTKIIPVEDDSKLIGHQDQSTLE